MSKKKAKKKYQDKVKVGSKSQERKKVLELINNLVDRGKDVHLNAVDRDDAVSELRAKPNSASILKGIAIDQRYSIKERIMALTVLKDMGEPIDEELFSPLKAVEGLMEETSRFLEDSGKGLPDSISSQILDLGEGLQKAFIGQLIHESGEKSLSLFTELVGRNDGLDLEISESLAYLPVVGSVGLLRQIASESKDKTLDRTIKKSLYQLKKKGVVVEDKRPKDSPVFTGQPHAGVSEGYLSAIDSSGGRLIWLIRPKLTRGLYFFQALTNDTEGIEDFMGSEVTRKMVKEYLALVTEENSTPIVEADPSYCQLLIEEGYAMTMERGRALPEEYLKWRNRIGMPQDNTQRPLIYTYFKEEAVKEDKSLLERSETLFELPEFENWLMLPDEIKPYTEMIKAANESKLILSPIQKQERIFLIYNNAVRELFSEERCLLYKRRMEEVAYVLYKSEKEDQAEVCLAAALALDNKEIPSARHPFLLGLIQRSISFTVREEDQKESETPSFIIKP